MVKQGDRRNQSQNSNQNSDNGVMSDEVAQNPGQRAAAVHADPKISLEEARAAAAGESPNASGSVAPSEVEDHVPSTSDPNPTDIPSTDHPLPDDDDETTAGSPAGPSEDSGRYSH